MLLVLDRLLALRRAAQKGLAVLIDPDSVSDGALTRLVAQADAGKVDFFFVGGSLMINNRILDIVPMIRAASDIPVVLFPGSLQQIVPTADAILFLSLISGRNPDLLIGNHVLAAPLLRQTSLEIIPTGYMLIESGRMTTANYISGTLPIPHDKPDIAMCTALAGEMLGLRLIYMDGGSGAERTISSEMIQAVSTHVRAPLVIGGGIRSAQEAARVWAAGADLIVIGNALEKDPDSTLLADICATKNDWKGGTA